MKADYIFIKRMLNAMQDMDSHIIDVKVLAEEVKSSADNHCEDAYYDKFFGHLHLLKDNNAIEVLKGTGIGVAYCFNRQSNMMLENSYIRLTSQGYDFADMLNKKGILEKIKDVSVSSAIFLSKEISLKAIENLVDKIV